MAWRPPDGNAWICGDCDAARNFDALDLGTDTSVEDRQSESEAGAG
jgi:hypothetical protein